MLSAPRPGGDFRLEAEDVAVFYADVGERLRVQQLFAGRAVVELVAQRLAVRGVRRRRQLLGRGRSLRGRRQSL